MCSFRIEHHLFTIRAESKRDTVSKRPVWLMCPVIPESKTQGHRCPNWGLRYKTLNKIKYAGLKLLSGMQGAAFTASTSVTLLHIWISLQQLDKTTSATLNVSPWVRKPQWRDVQVKLDFTVWSQFELLSPPRPPVYLPVCLSWGWGLWELRGVEESHRSTPELQCPLGRCNPENHPVSSS